MEITEDIYLISVITSTSSFAMPKCMSCANVNKYSEFQFVQSWGLCNDTVPSSNHAVCCPHLISVIKNVNGHLVL